MTAGPSATVAVLGAGSWGTALAMLLGRNGFAVRLWDRDADHIAAMALQRTNQRYLPGIPLPDPVAPLAELGSALAGAGFVLIAVPSAGFRTVLKQTRDEIGASFNLIWASKGLEPGSGRFLHEVVEEELPGATSIAALSGPSFATEVARGLPTAVTIASQDTAYAQRVAELFHCAQFRAYTSDDVIGVELGGSVKNVLAVATGICDGMGLGNNARAALITRGLAEMMRLGRALGAKPRTLTGLTGVGDLVLTCTGDLSRNRQLGLALGAGKTVDEAVAEIGQVVEGVKTAAEIWRLAGRLGVDMPISEQVYGIIHKGRDPNQSVRELLAREPKSETA